MESVLGHGTALKMWTLATAVVFASLLGSTHCVGMCGPLALWAIGGGNKFAIASYHLGRLTTYLSAGLLAGLVGSALTISGELAGFQSLASKLAGGVLIFAGLLRLFQLVPFFRSRPSARPTAAKPSRMAGWIRRAGPVMATFSPAGRAYFGGLLTTWLPCGWLYLFVLVAAGTGGVVPAVVVMAAFWIGTLPALTAVIVGAQRLGPRVPSLLPLVAGLVLIVTGLYTATGRASADLSSWMPPRKVNLQDVSSLVDLRERELPCCVDTAASAP